MQVSELSKLSEWYEDDVIETGIVTAYSNLGQKLQANSQSNTKTPFEEEREQLLSLLEAVSFEDLTLEQIGLLKHLEIYDLLGTAGYETIENILINNQLDIATASTRVNELAKRLSDTATLLSGISSDLEKCFSDYPESDPIEGDALLRVYFQDDASISNLLDFKDYGSSWYQIGYGVTIATGGSIEDIKVSGVDKGSIILELSALLAAVSLLSHILLKVLTIADRTSEIRKKSEEIRSLKLNNVKLAQEISEAADEEEKNGAKEILDDAIKRLKLKTNTDGDKITALEKAINHLIDFSKRGGKVDIIQASEPDEDITDDVRKESTALHDNIVEIRKLESKMRLLEAPNESESEPEDS